MSKEFLKEFKAALDSIDVTVSQFVSEDCSQADFDQLKILIGEFNFIFNERDPYKNNHELNDEVHIFYFKKPNLYIQFESEYSSWDAPRFGDFYLVEPYEVTETKYRKIK